MIKNLKVIDNDVQQIYYNDEMLNDGLIIEVETGEFNDDLETIITVHHLNRIGNIDLDAASYTLYWDKLLSPIQVKMIIQEIAVTYTEKSISVFIDEMNELSTSKISSSMQSDLGHSDNVIKRIKEVFNLINE